RSNWELRRLIYSIAHTSSSRRRTCATLRTSASRVLARTIRAECRSVYGCFSEMISRFFLFLLCALVAANATAQEPRRAVAEGISAFEHGDKSRAKTLLQQALKSDRRNVDAHTYLGMIAAEANEL